MNNLTKRNDTCPCGSGKKYKKCCGFKETQERQASIPSEQDLYAAIPSFECIPGCTDCCKGVKSLMFTKEQWAKVQHLEFKNEDCPYLTDQGCSCYEDRPFVCRLFGTVDPKQDRMVCTHGRSPVVPLTLEETGKLMKQYATTMQLHNIYWDKESHDKALEGRRMMWRMARLGMVRPAG